MTKILTVIGARPQFIKAAAVSRRMAAGGLTELLIHTGQHFDANMSEVFFTELGIPEPAVNLGISGGTHGAMTGSMLASLEEVMLDHRPDAVLVYGDTNSTLAGALAAAKLHIPVAHVEAGLRSFNKAMPEEVNRILTDHCADLLLTPTATATQNLMAEGMAAETILETGDVMYDAALHFGALAEVRGTGAAALGLEPKNFVLATVHRQENTDDPARLSAILTAFAELAADMPVVLPLHPRTKGRVSDARLESQLERLTILEPLGYLQMVGLERDAALIATDSGGVQKEAFFQRTPCVTLRDETEWTELVDAGWNRLVAPTDAAAIASALRAAIGSTGQDIAPYGKGDAADRIVAAIPGMLA